MDCGELYEVWVGLPIQLLPCQNTWFLIHQEERKNYQPIPTVEKYLACWLEPETNSDKHGKGYFQFEKGEYYYFLVLPVLFILLTNYKFNLITSFKKIQEAGSHKSSNVVPRTIQYIIIHDLCKFWGIILSSYVFGVVGNHN